MPHRPDTWTDALFIYFICTILIHRGKYEKDVPICNNLNVKIRHTFAPRKHRFTWVGNMRFSRLWSYLHTNQTSRVYETFYEQSKLGKYHI